MPEVDAAMHAPEHAGREVGLVQVPHLGSAERGESRARSWLASRQPAVLPRALLCFTRRAGLQVVRHRSGRLRQPAVADRADAQADQIDGLAVALARPAVDRALARSSRAADISSPCSG
jgi:hypothetical protein